MKTRILFCISLALLAHDTSEVDWEVILDPEERTSRAAISTGWPDDKSLSRRVPPADEVASPPAGPPPGA